MSPRLGVLGHYGIGDCIHQRAVARELMRSHRVELHTFYSAMYHDLAAEGLEVVLKGQTKPRIREQASAPSPSRAAAVSRRITYNTEAIHKHGSILAAQFASVGLRMPARPDFSLPVKDEWRQAARKLISQWDMGGKPLLVYRPIVQNGVWSAPARSPDPEAYEALYRSIRDRFFVVSVCDLSQGGERIIGTAPDVDVAFHRGELPFETLAGVVAEAAMMFGNPGFGPVLAQSVGTPVVCVYGANESFRTTLQPGAHLAPTLSIEPITPCEHHSQNCKCDKTIDVAAALPKLAAFVEEHGWHRPRVLIFGTAYVDTPEKQNLARQWCELHRRLNPGCDLVLVDSASPLDLPHGVQVLQLGDNIGHLARGGKDGWGRAFCAGIDHAVASGYDYVVHIEGDSLFRLPVLPILREMQGEGTVAASVPVEGTKHKEEGWVETGLMFLDCEHLADTGFTVKYDWANRKPSPTPEKVIAGLLGSDLKMMPWKAERGDRGQITPENATDLDWITHAGPPVYDRFVAEALGEPVEEAKTGLKLNFGCGSNRLDGWENFDAEVDITKPLPFADGAADYILAEHVVEHVEFREALAFFKECRRVLKLGGAIRIAVPSVENVMKRGDRAYIDFAAKWAPTKDLRGAMHAIMFAHGHKTVWTQSLLHSALFAAGFDNIVNMEPGKSLRMALKGVDGHGKAIGERFNWIETAICEAA